MSKLFGRINMNWPKVVVFAIIAGIYTGLVMLVPALNGTSFQDIGISYEWWVIFAVIIVVNCDKWWEAMLKCFVFFLISQPLVYAVEVVAGSLSLDLAINYYTTIWLPATVLTLPGGLIAYFCKKQNAVGAVILGLGNTIQLTLGICYFMAAVKNFPYHIVSAAVCFASVFIMSYCIQKQKKNFAVAIAVPVVLAIGIVIYAKLNGLSLAIN